MHIALNRKCFTRAMVVAGTTALCLTLTAGSTLAQEQEVIEEIHVTGSRIARDPNLGAPVAVQSVSAQDIQLSGAVDIVDVVRRIPALMTSENIDGSSGPAGTAFDSDESSVLDLSGESALQLRGMGLERTLVLVNGRRHVSGSPGVTAVNTNTIPQGLIDRVEVLTGGASAIYGADAVTGVVNFIMKDDYEGLEFTVQGGVSSEGDGEDYRVGGLWGTNFAGDRGNIAIAVDYRRREGLKQGDRSWSANNGIASDDNNPALRFQNGDIDTTGTPNFSNFYSTAAGRYPWGFRIPGMQDFIDDYTAEFGAAPNLTAAEQALFDRSTSSPTRIIAPFRTFSISSEGGVITPENWSDPINFAGGTLPGLDLNNNGVDDCLDTFSGFNASSDNFLAGGCWHIDQGGVVRVYDEGLIAGNLNQFGGDGVHALGYSPYSLTPDDENISINLMSHYDLTDTMTFFAEVKFVTQETELFDAADGFYDLLFVAPDNPFIPAALAPIAATTGGFRVTRDPNDFGDAGRRIERETTRFVIGVEGEISNGWTYEFALNHGETSIDDFNKGQTIMDRYFAAIDVTSDASGNPICRSELNGSLYPTTPFNIPLFDAGFFTFNPMDGSCQPYNILNGPESMSQAAKDWMLTTVVHAHKIQQTVFSGVVGGELDFGFDAGNVQFAAGAEVRSENSRTVFDPLTLGRCPVSTPDCLEGQLIRNAPGGFRQSSLVFDPEFFSDNSSGSYNVWDLFGEVDVPLLSGASFAEELSFNAAARFSQYSNIGDTVTWQVGMVWAPVEDITFRTTLSQAVRAPNVAELFNPDLAATFRPDEPCEQSRIDALVTAGDPTGAIRQANCLADGIPMGFQDPLSARFSGVTSGNAKLTEEEADTFTIGFVFTPTFLEGLTASVDFWTIEINDAIDFLDDQDIVDNCYDQASFPNPFCSLFSRNRDPSSAQFLGLNFLRQQSTNFGKWESEGIDFGANYAFEIGTSSWDIGVQGSNVDKNDRFFDPVDPTNVDPELGELRRPELAGTAWLGFGLGPFYARWTSLYQDSQGLADVEVETASFQYGPAGFSDEFWAHDLSLTWDYNDNLRVFGGVNNLTDERPFITESAYPVGPRGRFYFFGVNYAM